MAFLATSTPFLFSQPTQAASSAVLNISIPGVFTGCSESDPTASAATLAILDLVRPSAFASGSTGRPTGANGPIAQAELTAISPVQQVTYTIDPTWLWSDGTTFTVGDMVAWFQRARSSRLARNDGYQYISSLQAKADLRHLVVTFSTPYANWTSLFRDMEKQKSSPDSCSLESLVKNPGIGPYVVASASPHRFSLKANSHWPGSPAYFPFVNITAGEPQVHPRGSYSLSLSNDFSPYDLTFTTGSLSMSTRLSSSDQIVTLAFSPLRQFTANSAMRLALGGLVNRTALTRSIYGQNVFSVGNASSAVFAQSSPSYSGPSGISPFLQNRLAPTTSLITGSGVDCVSCAISLMHQSFTNKFGYWSTSQGQPLALRLISGPGKADLLASQQIIAQYAQLGVPVYQVFASTEAEAALASAVGRADCAVYTRSHNDVFANVLAWIQSNASDNFDSSWRSSTVTAAYQAALSQFNATSRGVNWATIDSVVLANGWETPLFTIPSMMSWTNQLQGPWVAANLSTLLNQVPTWYPSAQNSGP